VEAALGGTVQETRGRSTGAFPLLASTRAIGSFATGSRFAVMAALFGPSEQELERLRSTVQTLGTTNVPGLAAALSWRERKAERLLAHELARPGTPITYDPGRRLVRWARPLPLPPSAGSTTTPVVSRSTAIRTPAAPSPVFTPAGVKTLCPSCHVALQSTGSGSLAVCPQCGRLSSIRSANASGRSEAAPVPAPPPPPAANVAPAPTAGPPLADRRSQEMFAAWVTAQPIPCPKCRTPLRHRGVNEYSCPACGQTVRFAPPATAAVAPTAPPS
jgi:predicted RNA-binding Zn-ribbon protein involved in translation (DUF1610 family)